jgi:hypothetical protein
MLKLLKSLFTPSDPLVAAGEKADIDAFVRAIVSANVHVLAAIDGEGIDPTASPEEVLAEIERAARDLSDHEKCFEVFVYEREGASCVPFFSSLRHCEAFCAAYSKFHHRMFPFKVLGVKGSVVAAAAANVENLIMNDWTPEERPLSADEKNLLTRIAGSAN